MIAAIVGLLFLSNTWHWDASATADGYNFCWTYDIQYWSRSLCADTGLVTEFNTIEFDPLWAVAVTPGLTMYYQVRAYNVAGFDTGGPEYHPAPTTWVCP